MPVLKSVPAGKQVYWLGLESHLPHYFEYKLGQQLNKLTYPNAIPAIILANIINKGLGKYR